MKMSKSTLIATLAIVVLAVGGGYAIWQQTYTNDTDLTDKTDEQTDDSQQDGVNEDVEEVKRQEENGGGNDNGSNENDNDNDGSQSEPDDDGYDASIVLNNFGQQEPGSKVYANATVNGRKEGTCEFRFSRGNSSVVKTAQIRQAPTGYYACGVNVSSSEFSPKGEWTARVYLRNTDPQVRSEQRKTEIQ